MHVDVRGTSTPVGTDDIDAPAADDWWRDRWLLAGVIAVALVAAALRSVNLFDFAITVDEPLVVEPARRMAQGALVPETFDYPPLPSYVTAAALWVASRFSDGVLSDPITPYHVGRVVTVAFSGVLVLLTGLLGGAVAPVRSRRAVALVAAAAVAVNYLAVRLGNHPKPDVLQDVWMVGAALAAVVYLRRPRWSWMAATGLLAGLAGATKYAGAVVGIAGLAAVVMADVDRRRRLGHLAGLAAGALTGFLAGTLGTVATHFDAFWIGFMREYGHQRGPHLGYEPGGNGWWFHLTESMSGSWSPGFTVLVIVGALLAAWRGNERQRLVAVVAAVTFATLGLSAVRFPHYLLLAVPFLAVLAGLPLGALAGWLAERSPTGLPPSAIPNVAVAVVAAVALTPPTINAARLVNTLDAPDTRTVAAEVLADRDDATVWAEAYTTTTDEPVDVNIWALGLSPDALGCDCVLALSSHQEGRFRRRPDLYAEEIAIYDRAYDRGRVLEIIGPDVHLPYNWDLLPRWGMDQLPAIGPTGPIGPTITLLDLRDDDTT